MYQVPSTTEEMLTDLSAAAELAHATEWKKAALVAALVGPAPGSGGDRRSVNRSNGNITVCSIKDLSARKYRGLRSDKTIRHYRDVWFKAGFSRPEPGEQIDFTKIGEDFPWPGFQHAVNPPEKSTPTPEAITEAIMADPVAKKAAMSAVEEAVERDFRAAIIEAGGDPDNRRTVPDPVPRWKRLCTRIFEDTEIVKAAAGEMERNGQHAAAQQVMGELRRILGHALAEVTEIPDTIEGIAR